MRDAAHHEPVGEIIEPIQVLQDQCEAPHQHRILEVPRQGRHELRHEQRIIRRQIGDEIGTDRQALLLKSTQDDIDGLTRWPGRFGPGFRGVLAFVYQMLPTVRLPADTPDLFAFRDHLYLMRAVDVADYRDLMGGRSRRWGTVHLSAPAFRRVVKPFSEFLKGITHSAAESTEEEPTGREVVCEPREAVPE
jgi:hypothetical protein